MANKEIGDKWFDENGNEYEVKGIQGTIIVSESIEPIVEDVGE